MRARLRSERHRSRGGREHHVAVERRVGRAHGARQAVLGHHRQALALGGGQVGIDGDHGQGGIVGRHHLALGDVDGLDVVIDPDSLELDPASAQAADADELDSTIGTKLRLAQEFAERPADGDRRIVFRFLTSPVEIGGDGKVESITVVKNEYNDSTERVSVSATDEPMTRNSLRRPAPPSRRVSTISSDRSSSFAAPAASASRTAPSRA